MGGDPGTGGANPSGPARLRVVLPIEGEVSVARPFNAQVGTYQATRYTEVQVGPGRSISVDLGDGPRAVSLDGLTPGRDHTLLFRASAEETYLLEDPEPAEVPGEVTLTLVNDTEGPGASYGLQDLDGMITPLAEGLAPRDVVHVQVPLGLQLLAQDADGDGAFDRLLPLPLTPSALTDGRALAYASSDLFLTLYDGTFGRTLERTGPITPAFLADQQSRAQAYHFMTSPAELRLAVGFNQPDGVRTWNVDVLPAGQRGRRVLVPSSAYQYFVADARADVWSGEALGDDPPTLPGVAFFLPAAAEPASQVMAFFGPPDQNPTLAIGRLLPLQAGFRSVVVLNMTDGAVTLAATDGQDFLPVNDFGPTRWPGGATTVSLVADVPGVAVGPVGGATYFGVCPLPPGDQGRHVVFVLPGPDGPEVRIDADPDGPAGAPLTPCPAP
ncbi:MAG: hypothetical protein H6704_13625 [Myxococcales bacterium]|nr:hypothetical protein [Myxococcales bacterium]